MNNLKLTLYDVFGYLLPGFLFGLSLMIVFWAVFLPKAAVVLMNAPGVVWWFLVVAAYIFGHIAQAITNVLFKPGEKLFLQSPNYAVMKPVMTKARKRLGSDLGMAPESVEDELLLKSCHYAVSVLPGSETHEIYVCREGFYRTLTISFGLMSIALVLLAIRGSGTVIWEHTTHQPNLWFLLSAAFMSFLFTVLMWQRYQRFAIYRVTQAVYAYVLADIEKENNK